MIGICLSAGRATAAAPEAKEMKEVKVEKIEKAANEMKEMKADSSKEILINMNENIKAPSIKKNVDSGSLSILPLELDELLLLEEGID